MMFVVSVASSSMELARLANFPVMIVHYVSLLVLFVKTKITGASRLTLM